MKNNNLLYQSAAELVLTLANKKISSVELLDQTIARIEWQDPTINAVVVRDFERARIAAKAADAAIARGERLPLLGLPITVKESFNIAGLPTTWGNLQYKNWLSSEDELVIARLKKAGAIIIGKTNVPWMLKDWQTYNEIYGTTNNPWDLTRTPGGSSGGSAAALAMGFTALELGSDLAGSIRVPASFCGVFGHKPSAHLIPTRGLAPPMALPSMPPSANDLMVAGPLARTASDLALALDILAGPDEMWDGKGYKLALPPARHNNIRDFRVLILKEHPLCKTATSIQQSIDNLAEKLTKLGVSVSRRIKDMPDLAQATRIYLALFGAFSGAHMPIEDYQKFALVAKKLSPDDRSISACMVRGFVLTHREWWHMATYIRGQLRQQWQKLFKAFDVVVCPVVSTPAFPHDHSDPTKRRIEIDGTLFSYLDQFAWPSIATVFGLPATVAPIGYTAEKLPIGVQIIGDYLEDATTIKFASLLEREFGGPLSL